TPSIQDVATSIQRRQGTVFDSSIAVAACIVNAGGTVRIAVTADLDGAYHAYPEVLLPSGYDLVRVTDLIRERYGVSVYFRPNCRTDANENIWINLDRSAGTPGGPYRGPNAGHFLQLPGNLCYEF
ncbi:MAG: hypothetical protein AAFZ52_14570, partial [Bacteroidota bacterium]